MTATCPICDKPDAYVPNAGPRCRHCGQVSSKKAAIMLTRKYGNCRYCFGPFIVKGTGQDFCCDSCQRKYMQEGGPRYIRK